MRANSFTVCAEPSRVGICITNNPGYAGRTELPENLQSLFRPISMVKPDFTLIAEVLLLANGFITASALATKGVEGFSIASALLSHQTHYDWGLRAMKAVLINAGEFGMKGERTSFGYNLCISSLGHEKGSCLLFRCICVKER